jgi:hypothetical protein
LIFTEAKYRENPTHFGKNGSDMSAVFTDGEIDEPLNRTQDMLKLTNIARMYQNQPLLG